MLSVLFWEELSQAKGELNSRANPLRPISIHRGEINPVDVGATEPVW
jgi:hypothetical protein